MNYRAPIRDILRCMRVVGGEASVELADGTAESILDGAAAVAESVIAPLDRDGDRHGVSIGPEGVRTAPGWAEAYRAWIADGWNGLVAPTEAGGMGLPLLVHFACAEIWSGASLSFGLAPLLTSGAIEAIERHGSPAVKGLFLPKLVAGTWTGTMNLTEPQAGSDLSGMATRAVRRDDGTYAITGQKIFISYGDHDMADNIVHLVLARLPDAPPGTRGISLFVVPKIAVESDGTLGAPNDLRCAGIERKLGLHAAPTCTMVFGDGGGAVGYLLGEENKGLACMFTMMNNARLAVGIEGVAAAERATQRALAFARERRQGRGDPTSPRMMPIIEHPDVGRMLLTMRTLTGAARAICYRTAAALDAARRAPESSARKAAADRAALLTPVAKAFSTDIANEVASIGIQVHGGMGFVEDTGAAQILRDARVFAIYEGTNGIQAIDLLARKLPLEGGAVMAAEIEAMRDILRQVWASNLPGFGRAGDELTAAIEALERASEAIRRRYRDSPPAGLAVATPYLRLFGLTLGGASLCAVAVAARGDEGSATTRAIAEARFFAENLLPAVSGLERVVLGGGNALAEDPAVWIEALADVA